MAESRTPKRDSGMANVAMGVGLATAAVAAAAGAFLLQRKGRDQDDKISTDAPSWTLRDRPRGEKGTLIGRSVTINRPREEIYRRWRDFTAFPQFMENVERVEMLDGKRSRWTIKGPAGNDVELVTEITHDVPGERIAWKSTADSEIETAGEVLIRNVSPGRGAVVQLIQTYKAPGGAIGKMFAKVMQREPEIQARRDLRRFKQLLETGEITTNASPSGRKSESPTDQHRI